MTRAATPAPAAALDIDALAARLDAALAQAASLDPAARAVLDDALAAIDGLHRGALVAIVRALREDPRGKELLFELVDDPNVRMVLSMHGIVRSEDPRAAAERVLDELRPGIRSHGGEVTLHAIEGGVAYVRLSGACNGCSMAGVTMREGVERALVDGVPSIAAVEVLPDEPADPQLLQITMVGAGAGADEPGPGPGWIRTLPAERLPAGALEPLSLQPVAGDRVEAIVVNAGGRLAAYVNACVHEGRPLNGALVDDAGGTLTCPWHGACYDATSGACLTLPGRRLQQLPLRVQDGHVWVRVEA